MKDKGFTLIEVIISITILSIIVGGLYYAFAIPLASTGPLEIKLLAYTYSQKEMEMIMNSSFHTNFSKTRQTYPSDNRLLYEIIETIEGDINLKNITIRFFEASSSAQISEIYSVIRNYYINAPTITANLNPNPIYSGQSSTLSWTTTNATSLTILPGIGNIPAGEVASGSRTVSPSATTTYNLTATGPGGTSQTNITLTVLPPGPPLVSASLNPTTINPGQTSVLSWTTTNATSLTILPGIGNIPAGEVASGSRTVSPPATTTYTLTATGPGGTTNTQVTLTVGYTEDFNDGNYQSPTFLWNNHPSGQWDVVLFGGSNASRFDHPSQTGSSYPATGWSSPTNNYLVEGRVYISHISGTSTAWAAIGGRCTTGGLGYYVRIDIEPSIVPVRTRITLRNNDTALLTTTNSGVLLFNQWVTLGLEMNGNSISYYFNGQLLGTLDNDPPLYSSGRLYLRADTGGNNRLIYFDDLRIVFRP